MRYTKSGNAVASFTIACGSDKYISKDGEEKEFVAFVNGVAWGEYANEMGQLHKGERVFLQGRLQTRSYEANDGSKKYVTEVVARHCGKDLNQKPKDNSSNFDNFNETPNNDEQIPF